MVSSSSPSSFKIPAMYFPGSKRNIFSITYKKKIIYRLEKEKKTELFVIILHLSHKPHNILKLHEQFKE